MAKKKPQAKTVSLTEYAALTTYSDLLSLLLTLFVLLFALSEPKKPKLAATLAAISQHLQGLPPPTPPSKPAVPPQKMTRFDADLIKRGAQGRSSEIATVTDSHRQTIILGGDRFFRPGSARLLPEAMRIIQQNLAPELKGYNTRVELIGHADRSEDEGGNPWNLAYDRAYAVMRFLVVECQLSERRFRVVSGGTNEPRDPANPEVNRRVEVVVTSALVQDGGGPALSGLPPASP